jgi:hypothetical protein
MNQSIITTLSNHINCIDVIEQIIMPYQYKGINPKVLKRIVRYGTKSKGRTIKPSRVKRREHFNNPKEREARRCRKAYVKYMEHKNGLI